MIKRPSITLMFSLVIAFALTSCEHKVKDHRKEKLEKTEVAKPVLSQTTEAKRLNPTPEIVNEFYEAIFANNTQKVSNMLKSTFPANFEPKNKIRPLDAVIRTADNLQLATLMIDGGANINDEKNSFILGASEYKRLDILKYLIKKGASFKNNGSFHRAGFYQFYEGAKILLLNGANQNGGDIRGKLWVFHEAIRKSDYEVLNALKLTKDDLEFTDCTGETALIIAIKNNNIAMVKYLIEKGVDKNKTETWDCGDDVSYGKLPIEIAKDNNFGEIVEVLK